MKLRHAGFDIRDTVLASSDASDERVVIMERYRLALGTSFDRIVYVGDAEWDMQATETLGWHFIGVGARLKGKCRFWVEDFADQDAFLAMLSVSV